MNYFEFYGIPVSFEPAPEALRKIYYTNSRKYHPDFYTQESEEQQAEVLERSTLNNEAYKTLSDFDLRMKYILQLKGAMPEEGQNKLPQDFLMEMMDINENLMELQMDFAEGPYEQLKKQLAQLERDLIEEVRPLLQQYDHSTTTVEDLAPIRDYYLKKRYLLRIRENLNKFVPHS